MLGKQAKIVSPMTIRRMLNYARHTRYPKRDTVIVLMSVKAGMRACEIAGLQWSMVMTDAGKVSDIIDIRTAIAKRGSGRRVWSPLIGAVRCGQTRLSIGSSSCLPNSALMAAHRIPAEERSSRPLLKMFVAPAAACVTFKYSPVINRSRPPSATSMAIHRASVGLSV